jgi:hypothetical protein
MSQYLLLLYDNPANWKNFSPEDMQKAIEKYMAWRAKLQNQGILRGGQKLADDVGKVLRGSNPAVRVTDGPYSETKEVLGGYFLLEAPDYAAAVKASRDCPHLAYGGTIEVRQVDESVPQG